MKKLLLLIIFIPSLISFGCVTMSEVKTTPEANRQHKSSDIEELPIMRIVGGVNKEQPISIGEVIYSASLVSKYYSPHRGYFYIPEQAVSYSYMGLDDRIM